jgi:pimeloyl-ACP methyl ester carboxylesterase
MLLVDASGLPQFRRKSITNQGKLKKSRKAQEMEAPLFFALMRKAWFRTTARYLDPYFLAVQGVKSAYNDSPVVTRELINRYYELNLREGSREATISRFGRFGERSQEPADANALSLPTLVMWGSEDTIIPVSVAEQFASALANTTLIIYADVGHMPMEEIPERSAEDVTSFLEAINFR